ncbi:MAG: GrdX protein [Clostridia bacterium]|nr:GrdX protein [Clostridia bacterium]
MRMVIITNNPMARDALSLRDDCDVRYEPVTYREVLLLARDAVHKGHKLLTHPLSGSVKPGETPYKSLAISKEAKAMDMDSLSLIENCIATCDKFPIRYPNLPESLRQDFQTVDLSLIQSIF